MCKTASDCFYTTTILSGFDFDFEEHFDNDDLVRKSVPEGEFGKGQFGGLGSDLTERLKRARDASRATYTAAEKTATNAAAQVADAQFAQKNWCRRLPAGKSCTDHTAKVVANQKAATPLLKAAAAAKLLFLKAKAAFDAQSTNDRAIFDAAKGKRRRRRGEGSDGGGFSLRSAMNQLRAEGKDLVSDVQMLSANARNTKVDLSSYGQCPYDTNTMSL